jgi:hypothetical protein
VRFYEITLSAVTFDEWDKVVKKALEQAKRGDSQARKWLSDYLIGPPQQRIDHTTDGQPLKIVVEYARDKDNPTEPA